MNNSTQKRRIGFIAILVYDRETAHQKINEILHQFSPIIVGRLGLPYRERNFSIISLIVDGNTDEIGALTGQIGQLPNVTIKSGFAKLKDENQVQL